MNKNKTNKTKSDLFVYITQFESSKAFALMYREILRELIEIKRKTIN